MIIGENFNRKIVIERTPVIIVEFAIVRQYDENNGSHSPCDGQPTMSYDGVYEK